MILNGVIGIISKCFIVLCLCLWISVDLVNIIVSMVMLLMIVIILLNYVGLRFGLKCIWVFSDINGLLLLW